ncbi:unnamed protein product (macronuclear) [Paramecium tetraurelia]|uniref:Transmembrane protein n=1 Tax=Paramecium tetraurelia TaxID=5888 RepID=A0E3A6_PARTE|nr:uncharacterized protein GSPATT00022946001 [Paramecium tetraurelia]CAK89773.1 unnamed protein product [Paramecium tetraurelia]|eukprot:XP_001457170.1 hypothetical protein (macronuclear) [Paramecium tetraurelia strain d4-2]
MKIQLQVIANNESKAHNSEQLIIYEFDQISYKVMIVFIYEQIFLFFIVAYSNIIVLTHQFLTSYKLFSFLYSFQKQSVSNDSQTLFVEYYDYIFIYQTQFYSDINQK